MSRITAQITIQTLAPVTFSHHGIDGLPLMTRVDSAQPENGKTVFLPASQLRGRIRHEAALAHMRSIKASSRKIRLADAYMLALGQDTEPSQAKEDEAIRLLAQMRFRRENPFLDLFGTWKLPSRLYVQHLLPATNVMPMTIKCVRRDLDANPGIIDLLDEDVLFQYEERKNHQSNASRIREQVKLAKRALSAARKKNDSEKIEQLEMLLNGLEQQALAASQIDSSNNTMHLAEFQAIPMGLELSGSLFIERATPCDLMVVVKALESISARPFFGGHLARGCGLISGKAAFYDANSQPLVTLAFGHVEPCTKFTAFGQAFIENGMSHTEA